MPEGETINYYFNPKHPLKPYTSSALANPGTFPPNNATRSAPPGEEIQWKANGQWPAWDAAAESWVLVPDHREESGYVNGVPVTIKDIGEYPAGWSTEPPPLTEAQLNAQRKAELLAELDALDRRSARPSRAIIKALLSDNLSLEEIQTANAEEIKRISDIEAEAVGLREEFAGLA
jgi:hypothetical protein